MADHREDPATILRFWFSETRQRQWFAKDAGFDALMRDRFLGLTRKWWIIDRTDHPRCQLIEPSATEEKWFTAWELGLWPSPIGKSSNRDNQYRYMQGGSASVTRVWTAATREASWRWIDTWRIIEKYQCTS